MLYCMCVSDQLLPIVLFLRFGRDDYRPRVYHGAKTCEVFLCFVAIVRVWSIMLTSLFSLFYVTGECHRFLLRG